MVYFLKRKKERNKIFNRVSEDLPNIPVISVVSSTKNEFVAVQEDVTLYGHCSKHLKYSERKCYIKMCDYQRANIISLTIYVILFMKELVMVSKLLFKI